MSKIFDCIRPFGCAALARAMAPKSVLLLLIVVLGFAQGCALRGSSQPEGGSSAKYSSTSSKTLHSSLISTARSQTGLKYKRGGTSPATGFDCSGFVAWTFKEHGIIVPRTTREQMKAGTAVRKDELRPGDVVAFKISNRRGYHTGIYTGNGKFIHSPSTGKSISEDSIHSEYWGKRYIGARRVK